MRVGRRPLFGRGRAFVVAGLALTMAVSALLSPSLAQAVEASAADQQNADNANKPETGKDEATSDEQASADDAVVDDTATDTPEQSTPESSAQESPRARDLCKSGGDLGGRAECC